MLNILKYLNEILVCSNPNISIMLKVTNRETNLIQICICCTIRHIIDVLKLKMEWKTSVGNLPFEMQWNVSKHLYVRVFTI